MAECLFCPPGTVIHEETDHNWVLHFRCDVCNCDVSFRDVKLAPVARQMYAQAVKFRRSYPTPVFDYKAGFITL